MLMVVVGELPIFGTRRVTFNKLISAGDFARLSGGSL